MPQIFINEQNCTRCGICVSLCPYRIVVLPDGGLPCHVQGASERCIACGHCEAACPSGAIVVNDARLVPMPYASGVAEIEPARLGAYLRMRRSIRRYREEPVERTTIEQLMDIVRFAPTGRNRQDVHWFIIQDTRELRRLTEMAIDWMRESSAAGSSLAARFNVQGMVRAWEEGRDPLCQHAPHLVIACAREDNPVAGTNAVIALAHLDIIAPAFGLGACWGGIFIFAVQGCEPLRAALGLPPEHVPIHCMMLGYPAIHYQRAPKRNPSDIVWR
ncbi:MAG: nitroreductase family protein [Geobacter sp.]|nr:nitroreductase family protein [Geobacter sp.]